MTRKHYKEIAKAIKNNSVDYDNDDSNIIMKKSLIVELCTIFKKDNPNFDVNKFKQACEL